MDYIFYILIKLIDLYTYVIFASVIISWLLAFGILSITNTIVYKIVMVIKNLTEPIFDAVRGVIPTFFGLDVSPIVILLTLQGLRIGLIQLYFTL